MANGASIINWGATPLRQGETMRDFIRPMSMGF